MQIVTHAEGEQPRIAIIFRGQGIRISLDEKIVWHQDVDVYWQCNAWADTKVSLELVKGTLSKSGSLNARSQSFYSQLVWRGLD